jgi:hypothetical protein
MPVLVSPQPTKRFSLRCRLGRHTSAAFSLRATGERWVTHLRYCTRCGRVTDLHAEKR